MTEEKRKYCEDNKGLVIYFASKYFGKDKNFNAELISAGNLGLCEAVEKMDLSKYKKQQQNNYMLKYIKKYVYKAIMEMTGKNRYNIVINYTDKYIAGDIDNAEIINQAKIKEDEEIDKIMLDIAVGSLYKKKKEILKAEMKGYTMPEIAKNYGVTKQRIFVLQKEAKNSLKKLLEV